MPVQQKSVCLSISKIQLVSIRQSFIWQVSKFYICYFIFFITFIAQILSWCLNEPETYEKNIKFKHIKQFQDPQLSHRNMGNEVVRLVSCKINSADCNCLDTGVFWKKKQAHIILEHNQTGLLPRLDLSGRPSTREIRCSPIFFISTAIY